MRMKIICTTVGLLALLAASFAGAATLLSMDAYYPMREGESWKYEGRLRVERMATHYDLRLTNEITDTDRYDHRDWRVAESELRKTSSFLLPTYTRTTAFEGWTSRAIVLARSRTGSSLTEYERPYLLIVPRWMKKGYTYHQRCDYVLKTSLGRKHGRAHRDVTWLRSETVSNNGKTYRNCRKIRIHTHAYLGDHRVVHSTEFIWLAKDIGPVKMRLYSSGEDRSLEITAHHAH